MQRAIDRPFRGPGRIHWNQDYVDVVMALVMTGFAFVAAVHYDAHLGAVGTTLLLLQTLPIAVRRRDPMMVLLVTGVATTAFLALGYADTGGDLGAFVALYTVAANESRRTATVAAGLTAVGVLVSSIGTAPHSFIEWAAGLAITYLTFGVAWLIGDNLRVRRAYTRQLEDRAAQLEREKEEKAVLAVADERARIARELHDVVAHHVSVMVVQAGGARRIVDSDPVAAKGALEAVEAAGRTALAEMRRMLEVLRTDDSGMNPQPGLGELERLIGQVRATGLPVDLSIEGSACCLPAGMDLAAFRIAQEALTNTVKHAGKAEARLTIRYTPDTLEIEALDNGRGAAASLPAGEEGGGHGLIGMRERVGLFGGFLEAGPIMAGGYRVFARLPLEEPPTKPCGGIGRNRA